MGLLRMRRPPIAALGGGIAASAILTFTTTEAAPDSFDPVIATTSGTGTWRASDGQTITSNSPTFTFAAGTKTVLLTDIDADAVTQLVANNDNLTGSITDLSALTNLSLLWLQNNQLTGSIPDLSALTNLEDLWLYRNQLTGSIPDLSTLTNLSLLWLHDNQLTGSIPDLSALTNLEDLLLDRNQLTGSIPDLSALTNLTRLLLFSNQLTGSIPDLSALTNLTRLLLYGNQLTGNIPDLSALTNLEDLRLYGNQLTGVDAGATNGLDSIQDFQAQDNSLTQSAVDEIALGLYTNRANHTFAALALNIGGTNAAPSGTYQDASPPTTGKEYLFKLCNDPDAEGFNTWTITYNNDGGGDITRP